MSSIIISSEKLKYYDEIVRMCEYAQYQDAWRDQFWQDLLLNDGAYKELLYYLEHQDFLEEYKVNGYSVLDIFVWQMRRYNIRLDRGKNGPDCDKIAMLLESFRCLMDMKEGSDINWSMEMKNGMDEL